MAGDMFLDIEGVQGESKDEAFKNKIDIDSWSFGCTNAGSMGRGGGGGSGKADFQDLMVTKQIDAASHELLKSVASGKHFPKAIISCRKAGGEKQHTYLVITMEDVFCSSFQTSGAGQLPIESFSLNYAKIKYEYKEQTKQGSGSGQKIAGYDREANRSI